MVAVSEILRVGPFLSLAAFREGGSAAKTSNKQILLAAALFGTLAFATAQAQQVPAPKLADQIKGTPPGTLMTNAYVEMVGRMAYIWGWPLVNTMNRAAGLPRRT